MNSDISTRPTYVPSGRIDAARLPLALLIFAGTGMAVTGGFLRMILWGPYPPIGSVGAVLFFLQGHAEENQRLAVDLFARIYKIRGVCLEDEDAESSVGYASA